MFPRLFVNIMLKIYDLEEGIAIGRPPSAVGGIPPVLQNLKKYFNLCKQFYRQPEPPLPLNFHVHVWVLRTSALAPNFFIDRSIVFQVQGRCGLSLVHSRDP